MKGFLAYIILQKEFENHWYPFVVETTCGSIEFVATHEKYKKKGVAFSIINHICAVTAYKEFIVEVADTNIAAVQLYKTFFLRMERMKFFSV